MYPREKSKVHQQLQEKEKKKGKKDKENTPQATISKHLT